MNRQRNRESIRSIDIYAHVYKCMCCLVCLFTVCVWICIPAHVQHFCFFMSYLTTDLCTSVSTHVFFVSDCACMHSHLPMPHRPSVSSSPSAGLYELLAALPSQLQPHVSRPEDNTFLQDMFGERSLHSLVKVNQNKRLFLFKFWFSDFNNHLAIARALQLSKRTLTSIMVEALQFFMNA